VRSGSRPSSTDIYSGGQRRAGLCGNRRGLVVTALIVVVLAMMVLTMLISAVTVVVVLTVPVSLVQLPAFLVVIVVRVTPIGPFVGRMVPASLHPAIVAAVWRPVSFYPDEAWAGERPTLLVADRRWRGSDVHRNLSRARSDDSGC